MRLINLRNSKDCYDAISSGYEKKFGRNLVGIEYLPRIGWVCNPLNTQNLSAKIDYELTKRKRNKTYDKILKLQLILSKQK